MGIEKNRLGCVLTILVIPLIVTVALLYYFNSVPQPTVSLKTTQYDYAPVLSKLYEAKFSSSVSLCQLYGGFGGYYTDPYGNLIKLTVSLKNFDCQNQRATYAIQLSVGPISAGEVDITTNNNPNPRVNFGGELMYYRWLKNWWGTNWYHSAAIAAIHYYDAINKIPYAKVIIKFYGGNTPTAAQDSYSAYKVIDVNLSQMNGSVYVPPSDLKSLYIRTYIVPYTPTDPERIGAFFNYPDMLILVGTVNDAEAVKSTFYIARPGERTAAPVVTFENTIIVPIGLLYSNDRSIVYVFALTITNTEPNVVKIGSYKFSSDGTFLSYETKHRLTLPVNIFYPDLEVYYINIPAFVQSGAYLVTGSPIKVALYSPTSQKIVVLDIDINATTVSATEYDYTVTAQISSVIDVSSLTGGDFTKARLMVLDFLHPKYAVTGLLAYRQTVFDSDVFLNPYGMKAWLYNGQWYSYKYKEVIPRIDYLYPKANVLPDYPAIYGLASPILLDLQVYSRDGFTAEGFVIYSVYMLPYIQYKVTPTKFKYEILYEYYVTPITITYEPTSPDQPTELRNVLVKIVIKNPYNVIRTPDARDVRFFTTNTYGADYFKYKGLKYTIESLNLTDAVFYVLIPQISANKPITIYMYSGFRYAQPVAEDYFSLISRYPVLVPKQ